MKRLITFLILVTVSTTIVAEKGNNMLSLSACEIVSQPIVTNILHANLLPDLCLDVEAQKNGTENGYVVYELNQFADLVDNINLLLREVETLRE